MTQNEFNSLYEAFNRRDIGALPKVMHPQVNWPNGWEGGRIHGHHGLRDYWQRQWSEINPQVTPVKFETKPDGDVAVTVRQTVKSPSGEVLFEGEVVHRYHFEAGLVRSMEIEPAAL